METKTIEVETVDFGIPGAPVPTLAPVSMPVAMAPESATLFQIIERASRDPAVDIDKLERLIAMQERVQKNRAQLEFDNAMADAQEGMKAIRADLSNSQTKSNYASYAQLDKAIRPIYSRHGFAVTFNTGDAPKDELRVLATVSHRGGHRQEYKLDMPADGKGAKGGDVMTRTHATGAAASYGQRYLQKLIWNLAVGDVDDDGNGASGDSDVEALGTGPRGPDGKLLSTYDVAKVEKANDFANKLIQSLNLSANREVAKEIWAESNKVPPGKKKSPLAWLRDNSPGQMLRCQTAYENVVGLE